MRFEERKMIIPRATASVKANRRKRNKTKLKPKKDSTTSPQRMQVRATCDKPTVESGPARARLLWVLHFDLVDNNKYVDAAAELGKNPVSKHQIQTEYRESRVTRDGTAESVSRDQTLRHEQRRQGNIHFPCSADHEQDWQPFSG